ncbi:MAG: hypothetical protein HY917_02465 [Candidatus Diapherotrites archaeon]|nr:hypothetical protein [Candidatus Diapherotrites archaeon]
MEAIVKTRVVGGSVMTTIPKKMVNEMNIRGNELIRLNVKKINKDFFGRLKGIGKFTAEDEMNVE